MKKQKKHRQKIIRHLVGIIVGLVIIPAVIFLITTYIVQSDDDKTIDKVDKSNVLILVMDAWDEFPWANVNDNMESEQIEKMNEWIDWWETDVFEVTNEKIAPLLRFARENGVEIVFSNMVELGWNYTIAPELEHKKFNEPIINLTDDLDAYMRGKGLDTILYAGFATNNCILGKPTGMKIMHEIGYSVILIRDCSLSGAHQVLTDEEAINYIEELGSITTSEEMFERLGND